MPLKIRISLNRRVSVGATECSVLGRVLLAVAPKDAKGSFHLSKRPCL
jgi:hypothetical protein